MINFYHRFLPGIAKCLTPLTEATKSRSKAITWTVECQAAFQAAKSALASATLLNHPDPKSETRLSTDSSDSAIGAELSQKHHGAWRPIAFFSRKLTPTQSRCSTFDRELLAIYSAIQHFRLFLEGRPFSVFTDHKPLTHALTSKTARSRQERQLSYIAEFTTDIQYISGTDNVVPDVLSRAFHSIEEPMVASASPIPAIDLAQMAIEQRRDPKVSELHRRFGDIHVDLVGPLPSSEGCSYLFTIVDRFTRWPEAVPIHNAETITCARALLRNWISRFGVPDTITSDQGPQFRLLGPCWMDELPIVLLGIRSTWKEDLGASPALLTYGTNLRIPGDFFPSPSDDKFLPDSDFVRTL
ncbi:hypothetical protein EGW08_020359 [Elysia chlorotica]|uniref:Integrase catalytic domain-containing protein n=1 Tax=Elysia chlorotica TaxID=188477 RepID=A0A433SRL7_ELYCH|nr:hypothetical protein EGW08_020359 [Elysia chlorotica]